MVRFAVTPPPKKGASTEPFGPQLALSRVHPRLVALERTVGGYAPPRDATRGWFDLPPKRGLAGYGLSRALRMLLDVLAGLTALEDTRTDAGRPFVHGELVPAMMRVDPSGVARLIPLAPWHWAAPGRLPASDRCGHLAPERLLGDAIDARSDVFSAGVLLWEALAGGRLFETDSVDSIVMRLMGGKVKLPELPLELSWAAPLKAVAMCALSVDPEQRFANCAELAEAIEAVAGDRVATHADVASYFGAPEPVLRPTASAPPPSLPTHHSSLSALVAPVQQSNAPAGERAAQPTRGLAPVSARRVKRTVWAFAVTSCLLGAVGLRAVARSHASHGTVQSAPLPGVTLPVAVPLTRASTAPPPSTVPEPGPLPAAIEQALPEAEIRAKPSTLQKSHSSAKGLAPKPKATSKVVRSPDKAAAKYGI